MHDAAGVQDFDAEHEFAGHDQQIAQAAARGGGEFIERNAFDVIPDEVGQAAVALHAIEIGDSWMGQFANSGEAVFYAGVKLGFPEAIVIEEFEDNAAARGFGEPALVGKCANN